MAGEFIGLLPYVENRLFKSRAPLKKRLVHPWSGWRGGEDVCKKTCRGQRRREIDFRDRAQGYHAVTGEIYAKPASGYAKIS
jgi:hypothetical protein